MNIEKLNKLKIQTQLKPMLQKFLSFIKGCLENNFYRRTFLFIVLVVLLLAAWKISAKIAWEKTLDKRAEYLYQLDKQRLDFEKNCGKIKILKINHVLSEDSIPPNKWRSLPNNMRKIWRENNARISEKLLVKQC